MEHGSVPLVLGAPNMHDFLPAPNAAINIGDYLSPSLTALSTSESEEPEKLSAEDKAGLVRLAERMKFIASREGREEYEQMLTWKNDLRWTSSPFGKVVALGREELSTECRLAGLLRGEEWTQPSWKPHRIRTPK